MYSWVVLILLKNDKENAVQGRLQKQESKRLIEELSSRERHGKEVSQGQNVWSERRQQCRQVE